MRKPLSEGNISVSCFGSSSSSLPSHILKDAYRLGYLIGQEGWSQFNGAGRNGVMGALTDGGKDAGGQVHGIIIEAYEHYKHSRLDSCESAGDFNKRKARLIEEGDFIVCLPGGVGTLSELMHAVDDQLVELYYKRKKLPPVILLNTHGYYTGLFNWIKDVVVQAGALKSESFEDLFVIVQSAEEAVRYIKERI
ncbi:MAG: LOG family protein [Candidatus Theseobacter exili]|nr:LOG family protein [Candidatus Theseobacter exili]